MRPAMAGKRVLDEHLDALFLTFHSLGQSVGDIGRTALCRRRGILPYFRPR